MKNIIIITMSLLVFSLPSFSGEIYIWKDKNGIDNITTTPPPTGARVKSKSSFTRDNPAAIDAFQRKQREMNDRGYSGWQNSQNTAVRSSSSEQDARNHRSEKLKSDTAASLRAIRDRGIKLPQANIDLIEKAAASRAEQIKDGTARPMTAQEDADFNARQNHYELENQIRNQQREIDHLNSRH